MARAQETTDAVTEPILRPVTREESSGWIKVVNDPRAARLTRPSVVQHAWQEQELAMFVQLDPATVQQGECDSGSTPMKDIRFDKLDTDERCRAAKSCVAEIKRRLGKPLAVVEQVSAHECTLVLGGEKPVHHVDLWEDYRYGHRIRGFVIEGRSGRDWVKLVEGTAVGRRFPCSVSNSPVSQVRVRITQFIGTPLIRNFEVH